MVNAHESYVIVRNSFLVAIMDVLDTHNFNGGHYIQGIVLFILCPLLILYELLQFQDFQLKRSHLGLELASKN